MPNLITVSNIADRKAGSQRVAMSTTATPTRLLEMKIRFNSTPSSLANQTMSDDSPEAKCLRTNHPISLNKTQTIDGIDTPGLTING